MIQKMKRFMLLVLFVPFIFSMTAGAWPQDAQKLPALIIKTFNAQVVSSLRVLMGSSLKAENGLLIEAYVELECANPPCPLPFNQFTLSLAQPETGTDSPTEVPAIGFNTGKNDYFVFKQLTIPAGTRLQSEKNDYELLINEKDVPPTFKVTKNNISFYLAFIVPADFSGMSLKFKAADAEFSFQLK